MGYPITRNGEGRTLWRDSRLAGVVGGDYCGRLCAARLHTLVENREMDGRLKFDPSSESLLREAFLCYVKWATAPNWAGLGYVKWATSQNWAWLGYVKWASAQYASPLLFASWRAKKWFFSNVATFSLGGNHTPQCIPMCGANSAHSRATNMVTVV